MINENTPGTPGVFPPLPTKVSPNQERKKTRRMGGFQHAKFCWSG